MGDFQWIKDIESKDFRDRKESLWYSWRTLVDTWGRGNYMAPPSFRTYCRLMLTTIEYYDKHRYGEFIRRDLLDVLMADARGNINMDNPYPWIWCDVNTNNL